MGVEIEINHDCNRACAYCPNSIAERPHQGRMPRTLFVRILSQLRELGYQGRISYHFYNEPLLSPDLDEFVGLTKEYLPKCWIEIYTNGTLLSQERFDRLLTVGVDKFTVTRHHGIKDFPFTKVYESLDPSRRARVKFQHYKELYFTSRGGLMKVGYAGKKPPLDLPCLIPTSALVITVNGNIVPCFEDYFEKNVMGNIAEQDLLSIWNSDRYKQFRDDLKNRKRSAHPVCDSCNCMLIIN